MSDDVLKVIIAVPPNNNAWGGSCEIIARIPKYRKWWEFWKNNYDEVPCNIEGFINPEDDNS